MKDPSRFWISVLFLPTLVAFVGVIAGVVYLHVKVFRGDCSPLWCLPMGLLDWAAFSGLVYLTLDEEKPRKGRS